MPVPSLGASRRSRADSRHSLPTSTLSAVYGRKREAQELSSNFRKCAKTAYTWSQMTAASNGKRLLLLKPRGFCAGVVRAIDIVRIALDTFGPPIYVRKEIVHNRYVVEDLTAKGAIFVGRGGEVPESDGV